MTKQYLFPISLSIILIIIFSGCSDETTSPTPDPNILLTASFEENYMSDDAENCFVFVSAPDGQVLDVATWTGAATVVLKNPTIHPDTISVTTVEYLDGRLFLKPN